MEKNLGEKIMSGAELRFKVKWDANLRRYKWGRLIQGEKSRKENQESMKWVKCNRGRENARENRRH